MRPSAVKIGLQRAGVGVACRLPDPLFGEPYPVLDADLGFRTVRVINEGAAICGGVSLSGQRAAPGATPPYPVAAKVGAVVQPGRKHGGGRDDKYVRVRHGEATEGVVTMGPGERD